jgi:hypothetical protein
LKLEEVQFKLISEVQSLPPELALEYCNKSLREIYREHDWSFLYKRDYIRTPALINTGTVAVTKFSNEVIVNANLKTVLDAITVDDIAIEGRQFRTFSGAIAGSEFIYNILSYDSANSKLVIEPFYQDATNSVATYQIFKNRYTAPELVIRDAGNNILFQGIDFANFEFIYAPFHRRKLRLDVSRSELDCRDGSRLTFGDPFLITGYGSDSSGNRLFELYPIPNQERLYEVLYKIGGRDLNQEEEIPSSLNYDLILSKAKIKADEWMIRNGDKVGDKRNPNIYAQMMVMASNPNLQNSYLKLLEEAKLKDENLYPQALISMGDSASYYDCSFGLGETLLLDF